MTGSRLTDDAYFVAAIAAVWLLTAALYFLLPMLDMPPGQRVWSASAVLFALLAAAIARADLG